MTMQELWTEYGTEALIALGGGVLTALIMRIKAWQQDLVDEDAPLLRQAVAYVSGLCRRLGRRPHTSRELGATRPSRSRYRWLWR